MKYPFKILFQSFIKSFYRENAAAFIFVFTMMFFIVSTVDGAGLFAYHYSLIMGMLNSNLFLGTVFIGWLLYAGRCAGFILKTINDPNHSFLKLLNLVSRQKMLGLFFLVEILVLLPILSYATLVIIVGFCQHFVFKALLVAFYSVLLCMLSALTHVYVLANPGRKFLVFRKIYKHVPSWQSSYPFILLRYILNTQKMLWLGIHLFTCSLLYLVCRNYIATDTDISLGFLFYTFGIISNGILIHRLRKFEATRLSFFHSMPLPLASRFLGYAILYLILLMPEFFTLIWLTQEHLSFTNAIGFSLSGYAFVLLIHSSSFLRDFSRKEYLAIVLLVFCIQNIMLVLLGFSAVYLACFAFAAFIFFNSYYRFEKDSAV